MLSLRSSPSWRGTRLSEHINKTASDAKSQLRAAGCVALKYCMTLCRPVGYVYWCENKDRQLGCSRVLLVSTESSTEYLISYSRSPVRAAEQPIREMVENSPMVGRNNSPIKLLI